MFSDGGTKQGATVPALGGPLPPPYLSPPPPQKRKLPGQPGLAKKGNQEKGKFSGPRAINQSTGSVVSLL